MTVNIAEDENFIASQLASLDQSLANIVQAANLTRDQSDSIAQVLLQQKANLEQQLRQGKVTTNVTKVSAYGWYDNEDGSYTNSLGKLIELVSAGMF